MKFVEVVEHACSITSLLLGETLPNVSKDMDTISYRMPLGVTAGITPFNFPAMIPLWVSFIYFFLTIKHKTLKVDVSSSFENKFLQQIGSSYNSLTYVTNIVRCFPFRWCAEIRWL